MQRLVILAPNWLGDAVMALPAIADVRRAHPGAHLAVAARSSIAPLFTLVDGVDEIVTLEPTRPSSALDRWRRAGDELRGRGFDVAVLLPNSFYAALLTSRAGIPERWGYRTDWRGRLLTRAIDPAPAGLHQIEYYQHLAAALGCATGPGEPCIELPPAARAAGIRVLHEAGWNGRDPMVTLAAGAAYGGAKRWPAERFAALACALAADGVRPVLVGTRADASIGRDVERAMTGAAATNVIGRTDLPALAGVLAASRALVTNDSGAMHVAAALGVAVTAVFGPTDDRATRPRAADPNRAVVLTHPVWCRPCMLRECPLDHRCMEGIEVDAVAGATRRFL